MSAPTPPEVREAAVVEAVARAIWANDTGWGADVEWAEADDHERHEYRRLAAAAVAAYRATQDGGTCGDLSPSINLGGAGEAGRRMCELSFGHGGAHQHDNDDGLPPTRWIATQDGGAAEAVRRVEALAEVAGELDDLGMGFGMAAVGDSERGDLRSFEFNESISNTLRDFADRIRAALAPQAGDGAR